jgi:RNA polymerase sigma-70 factor (ECF subfamily)
MPVDRRARAFGTPANPRSAPWNEPCRPTTASAIGESFDEVVLPHLDAAYRLALWLMRNEHDAEDVVQEACLRALRYFRTFTGGNARAWFLRIVRNTACGWRRVGFPAPTDPFDEEQHSSARPGSDPETLLLQTDDVTLIARAMRNVPDRFRELLVLRELEGLSYRELADVIGIPIGTVMSSLSRARQAFRRALNNQLERSGLPQRAHPREQDAQEADAVVPPSDVENHVGTFPNAKLNIVRGVFPGAGPGGSPIAELTSTLTAGSRSEGEAETSNEASPQTAE